MSLEPSVVKKFSSFAGSLKMHPFICNEALSILENAAEFINIPQQLKDVLLQLRDKNAAKAEEKEESEE